LPGRTPGSLAGAALAAVLLSGCYQNTPLMSLPDPGAFVVLELNDQGRIGMVNNIGPDIARVEGVLASRRTCARSASGASPRDAPPPWRVFSRVPLWDS